MSLFDTLFPPNTRYAKSRTGSIRCRRRGLREAEALERRQPLTINRVTTDQFFVDPKVEFKIDSQYAEFEIKDTGYIADAWVKVEMLTSSPTVSFGVSPIHGRLNYEDGLYHIGEINAGEIKQAFIYFSTLATEDTDIDDPYRVTLYNGDPTQVVESTDAYSFQNVQVTQKNDVNKLSTVTFSPGEPVIGGMLTMYVTGRIGQTVDRVLFTPASRKDWLPDVYRLESVDIQVEGAPSSSHLLYYDPAPDGDPGNPFAAQYHFRIEGFNSDVIQVQPTQFTQKGSQAWEHHSTPSFPLPPVPFVKPRIALDVFKTDGSAFYTPGEAVTYEVTVTNGVTSEAAVKDVVVTDKLPAGTTFVSGSSSRVVYDPITRIVSYTTGTMAVEGFETFSFTIQTLSSRTDSLINTVIATPPSSVKGSSTSYTDKDDPQVKPGLTVTKTDKTDEYVPGLSTTYTIEVKNSGPSDLVNGTVFDELPKAALSGTWTAAVTGGASYTPVVDPNNVNATVNIPVGGTVTFTYTVVTKPNPIDVDGKYIDLVNVVTVSPPAGQGDGTSATDTDEAKPSADLLVSKSRVLPVPPQQVVAGEKVTYEIVVTNKGVSSVASFFFVDTTTPALLSPVSTTVSSGTYASGVWTAASGDTFDPMESVTFTISGTIPSGATGSLENVAEATPPKGVTDPIPGNNKSTVTDTILVKPGVTVTKTDKTDDYVPGTSTTYTIIVGNSGSSDLVGGRVVDLLPGVALSGSWTAKPSAGAWVSKTSGDTDIDVLVNIPVKETVEFTYTVDTKPNPINLDGTYADLVNEVTVTSPQGPDFSTSATDIDKPKPSADLLVSKSRVLPVPPQQVVAGEKVTYEIVVTNKGVSSVASFNFTDTTMPMLLSPTSTTVIPGTYASGVWTAASGETFDPGESVTFTISGRVPANATGSLENTATALPPKGVDDPDPNNNTSTVTDTIAGETQFTVTKDDGTDRYTPGTSTTYKIIVTNKGPSFLKGGIVEDLLPKPQGGSATWTVETSGEGALVTPDVGGNDINATIDLPVGGTATFFYTLNILATATGQLDNTVTVKPAPGTIGREVSVTDSNLPPTPPLSVLGGLVIGSDDGCNGPPFVSIIDPNGGQTIRQFLVYEPTFRGSVRVATGDVTGDGVEEILVAPGRGRVGEIRVFTQFGVELQAYRTFPFGTKWRGGVEVVAADINGDGVKDIVAGMSSGTGMVSGFLVTPAVENPVDPVANNPAFSFRGFPPRYAGGVMLSAGDFGTFSGGVLTFPTLDGRDEIVVGSNAGRVATVNVWDVSGTPRIIRSILPFGTKFKGGVTLSVANYDNSDNVQDIFVGAGVGGKSAVAIYSGATGGLITKLPPAAFGSFSRPNAAVFTAALDLSLTGDGPVTNIYGVQGRNGGRGTRGVYGYTTLTGETAPLTNSTGNLPPLRIAALKRRLL